MADGNVDLQQGTLNLLKLKTIATGPLHGWAIAKRIQQMSKDALTVGQGSLYPALYRMEERGYITSEPGISAEGRRITLYKPTAAGRKQLARKIETWEAFATAMRAVIRHA